MPSTINTACSLLFAASAGKNVCWPWWATTLTGTDMNAKPNCKGLQVN